MIGKIICDLAPTPQNNRNSEGAFITLKDGRLLFAYSRYGAEGADDGAAADIYGIISDDNGESFGNPFPILTRQAVDADNIMSVSFLRMKNDDIGMFFLRKKAADCLCFLIRSCDEGQSWSEPVLCGEDHGYFVVNNDRVIRCQNGTILIPAAFHDTDITFENGDKKITCFKPGTLFIFASDDDGFSWKTIAGNIALPLSRGLTTGVQEPGLLQLDDHTIWCYIRNDSGRQYESFSRDNGYSWSQPLPSRFTSPISPLCTKRLSGNRFVAIWNPIPVYNGHSESVNGVWTGARTPLVIAVSSDNGATFSEPIAIETDKNRGYCYTAIHETSDGSILLAYCAGGVEDKSTLNRLRIRKLKMAEL